MRLFEQLLEQAGADGGDAGGGAAAGAGAGAAGAGAAGGDAVAAGAGGADKGAGGVLDAGDKGAAGAGAGAGAGAADGDKKGYWAEDWRERMAGNDEAALKQLKRYASPEGVYKKARELEKRLSSGELRTTLPKDAKPEEVAAWRKDNGLPESPDKYDLKGMGIEVTEADKPRIDAFLKAAHDANYTPEQAKAAIAWQRADATARLEAQQTRDNDQRIQALDTLNEEWGSGFRTNVNVINGFLDTFPESVRELLKGGRLSDGTGIFNHPDVLRGFVAAALQVNPAAALAPAAGGDPMKGLEEKIAEHEKFMKEHRKEYDKDDKRRSDYRALLEARIQMNARKAA